MRYGFAVGILCGLLWGCTASSHEPMPLLRSRVPSPVVVAEECNGLHAQFTFQREPQSASNYHVYITDSSGQPLADASRVLFVFTPLNKDDNTTTLVALPTSMGAGFYAPRSTFTPTSGLWKVEVVVRRGPAFEAVCMFKADL